MSKEQDKIFFRNFSLSIAFIAFMMVAFFVVANFAGSDDEADAKMRAATVAKTTAPVGKVQVEGEESAIEAETEVAASSEQPSGDKDGKSIYDGLCVNCHGVPAMAAMIPQTGDATAWEARVAKGKDTLYDHAINGFTGDMGMMPARGSNPALTDEEVKSAVDYIVSQVSSEGGDTSAATSEASTDLGKKVFDGLCVNCHGIAAMAAMIPQAGDAAAWEARIAKGIETLYDHALNGFTGDMGMMPARGSNPALTDEEVKAAVDYIVEQSK